MSRKPDIRATNSRRAAWGGSETSAARQGGFAALHNAITVHQVEIGQAVASIQRLKALADFHDGEPVICHDPALWDKWKPAPHAYS